MATDSRYARIMRVMEETQQRRPRLRRLIEIARKEGIRRIKAEILSENAAMVLLQDIFTFAVFAARIRNR